MASRTEKQKTTYYDHFAKRWRVNGKSKRKWLSYLKKAANKKYRQSKKKEMDEVEDKSECVVGCDGICEECPIGEEKK